jgi:hypothetical protein
LQYTKKNKEIQYAITALFLSGYQLLVSKGHDVFFFNFDEAKMRTIGIRIIASGNRNSENTVRSTTNPRRTMAIMILGLKLGCCIDINS